MKIQVLFHDGKKEKVCEDTLQLLIVTKRIQSFKRSDGWVDVSYDKIRRRSDRAPKKDRRRRRIFASVCWS